MSDARSIVLSVGRRGARLRPAAGHGSATDDVIGPTLKELVTRSRSQSLCRCHFCDFPFGSSSVQDAELHHLNGDHSDNSPSNLVLCCTFCHDLWHLDLLHRRYGEKGMGRLVFLPELSHADFNKLIAAVFFAMECAPSPDEVQRMSRGGTSHPRPGYGRRQRRTTDDAGEGFLAVSPHAVLNRLIDRAEQLERMRPGLSDPQGMARMLGSLDDAGYARREELLYGIRFLPNFDAHRSRARLWGGVGGPFGALPMDSWASILQEA